MKGTTFFSGAAIAAFAVTGVASAGGSTIVFDQIGDNGGGNILDAGAASQYFEAGFSQYDIGALDDFSLDADWKLTSIEAIVSGFNGYLGLAAITGFQVNIYSSPEMAGLSLIGDVHSSDHATFDSNININDITDIVQFDVNIDLAAGTYYVAVIPTNEFAVNGQSSIARTDLGDSVFWQANPNGAFGFPDGWQETAGTGSLGYRIQAIPAPGALMLLGLAGLVTTRRRRR